MKLSEYIDAYYSSMHKEYIVEKVGHLEARNDALRFACKQALMGINEGYLPPKITDDLRDALPEEQE